MIGPKKLSEIKRELGKSLGKSRAELEAWVKERLRAEKPNQAAGSRVLEDLLWVRSLLRESVSKRPTRKKKAPRKESPAA